MRNASDDQCPQACMREGGVPFSAKKVVPPARIDWPLISLLKKKRRCLMKKDQVGIVPSALNQRAEWKGIRESQDDR